MINQSSWFRSLSCQIWTPWRGLRPRLRTHRAQYIRWNRWGLRKINRIRLRSRGRSLELKIMGLNFSRRKKSLRWLKFKNLMMMIISCQIERNLIKMLIDREMMELIRYVPKICFILALKKDCNTSAKIGFHKIIQSQNQPSLRLSTTLQLIKLFKVTTNN